MWALVSINFIESLVTTVKKEKRDKTYGILEYLGDIKRSDVFL